MKASPVPRYPADPAQLAAASRSAFDTILARRGQVAPMYQTLIASPAVALQVEALSANLWASDHLTPATRETVFLVVARKFHCEEQWRRHQPKARAAGLSDGDIDAIDRGLCPPGQPDVQLAFRIAKRLLSGRRVPRNLWEHARQVFGAPGLSELCAFLGLASLVALSINLQEDT